MTTTTSSADPAVLDAIRDTVVRRYGDRLERLILFGSRARGDAGPESDWDVAVMLRQLDNPWMELVSLADVAWEIQVETGAVVSLVPLSPEDLGANRSFARSVREQGQIL